MTAPAQLVLDLDATLAEGTQLMAAGLGEVGHDQSRCADCGSPLTAGDLAHSRARCSRCRARRELVLRAERDWRCAPRAVACRCEVALVIADDGEPRCVLCGRGPRAVPA